jgi:lipoprotein NlpD
LAIYSKKSKGIDIGDRVGTPIYASAPGKVVYAGNGLRGYGNLIIIKHNSQYLSAYAYNRRLLVREGDWVKKGQSIAEMGKAASGQAMLHFEIRRAGIPVNPLNLLSS